MKPEDEKFIREQIARFDQAEIELVGEINDRSRELEKVRIARAALFPLISDEPVTFQGTLADAIRFVLMAKNRSLTPVGVRDEVRLIGYDMSKHDNEMAAVHGVLKSLLDQDEVKTKIWSKEPNVTRYFWRGWADAKATASVPTGNLGFVGRAPHLEVTAGNTSTHLAKLLEATKPKASVEDTVLKPKK